MALSDTAIRAAKRSRKQFKLYDEGGLFLLVTPSGGKLWRLKYRHLGKEQTLSFGGYPQVSLLDARTKRDEVWLQGFGGGRSPRVVGGADKEYVLPGIEYLVLTVTYRLLYDGNQGC